MIKFRCPSCQTKLGVPDEYGGKRIRCNKCTQACVVPKPIAEVRPQPSAEPSKSPAAAVANPPAGVELQRAPQLQATDQLEFLDDSQIEIQEDPNAAILRQFHKETIAKQKIKSASAKPARQASVKAGKRERAGTNRVNVGKYKAGEGLTLVLTTDLAARRYTVQVNGGEVKRFVCAEKDCTNVQRLSLRTGLWRGCGEKIEVEAGFDVPLATPAVFRVIDMSIRPLK